MKQLFIGLLFLMSFSLFAQTTMSGNVEVKEGLTLETQQMENQALFLDLNGDTSTNSLVGEETENRREELEYWLI